MKWLLLPLLILAPYAGFSQTFSSGKLCFTPAEAARVADSLKVLPVVRAEAMQWQQASAAYLRQAASTRAALSDERQHNVLAEARAADYKKKAHRRGLLNWLFLAVAGGVGCLAITR
jgi:hypothetical protein